MDKNELTFRTIFRPKHAFKCVIKGEMSAYKIVLVLQLRKKIEKILDFQAHFEPQNEQKSRKTSVN